MFYLGIDPTAPALHVGHLLPLVTGLRLRAAGHSMVALIGSATAAVGDPSGRSGERTQLSRSAYSANSASIASGITSFYANAERLLPDRSRVGSLTILENASWLGGVSVVDFLRRVGPHAKLQRMLSRDAIRSRMEEGASVSFAELSYQLLQAYDFSHLYKTRDCQLQLGGADQWGNILAGTDLLHRANAKQMREKPVYGMTIPLMLNSAGEKFGKSNPATDQIWLDSKLTSPFQFYQVRFFVKMLSPCLRGCN